MKRILFYAFLIFLGASVFAGGRQQTGAPEVQQELDLSVRGYIRVMSRSPQPGLNKNAVFDILSEKFNTDLDWELIPAADYQNATMVTIASGNLPDVIETLFSGGIPGAAREITALYEEGLILRLNDLLKEYGSNIEKARPFKENWFWMDDGERASIPARFINLTTNIVVIRQDWLDNLGLKMPTTLDEVTEVARAFTFNDPDKNGRDDTIGLGSEHNPGMWGSSPGLLALGAYGVVQDWAKVGNVYEPWVIREGTREAVKWLRERYLEGVIERDIFTVTREQHLERMYQNRYGISGYDATGINPTHPWWVEFNNNVPGQKTVILPPVSTSGYNTVNPVVLNYPNDFQLLISSKTKEAPRIVSLIDFLATDEGANLAYFGPEGRAWNMVDGQVMVKELSANERLDLGVAAITTFFWHNILPMNTDKIVYDAMQVLPKSFAMVQNFPPFTGDTSALGSLANESLANMVSQPNVDVDSAFAQFRNDYYRMGGQAMIDYMTAQFNATIK